MIRKTSLFSAQMRSHLIGVILTTLTLLIPGAFVVAAYQDEAEPQVSQVALYLPLLRIATQDEAIPTTTPSAEPTDASVTPLPSATVASTATATNVGVALPTATPTTTATGTTISQPTEPVGITATTTATDTATATATDTATATATATNTATATATDTATATATATNTATATATDTATATATATNTATATATNTATATATNTATPAPGTTIVWRQVANFPRTRTGVRIGNSEGQSVVLNNKLYVFGGYERNTYRPMRDAYVFDPSVGTNGTWTQIADMPKGNTHAGIATDGRYIYIVAGYIEGSSGGQTFGTVLGYRYDPESNTYSNLPNLPAARAAGSITVAGRELHYFGGTNTQRTLELGNHWALNLDNFAAGWQVRSALPNPRHHMGAVSYNNKIYAIGGQHKHDSALIPQDDVHLYDPLTDSWTQLADLPEGRNHIGSTSFVLDEKIYVLGGQYRHEGKLVPDGNGNMVKEEARNTVFVYDIVSNSWSEVFNQLPSKRHSAVGGTIGGKLYFSTGSFSTATYEGTFVPAVAGAAQQPVANTSLLFRAATLSMRLTSSFEVTSGASSFYCAPDTLTALPSLINS